MSLAHLPTVMLLIGYAVFWIEMYFLKNSYGQTSPLAWVLFLLASIFVVSKRKAAILDFVRFVNQGYKNQKKGTQLLLAAGALMAVFIFICALYASLLPPHLLQEWDSLNYHMSLPRQHLIGHSFRHIAWAADDLFPMPVEFALAPYWFVTNLPNKFPQFLFVGGLVAVAVKLVRWQNPGDFLKTALVVFAILGSHNVGIQMGTAMLDLVICYLFLAAIDSFLSGAFLFGVIELTFFFWSKSFIPLQTGAIIVIGGVLVFFMRRFYCNQLTLFPAEGRRINFDQNARRFLMRGWIYFLCASLAVGAPFLIKSLYYAATPLYPFHPGLMPVFGPVNAHLPVWQSLQQASHIWLTEVKDQYGYGYSLIAFIKHLWLIAVPEEGVNNKYDYPVGLVYLLFVGPFLYRTVQICKEKKCSLISVVVILFWATWWMGSHQSRFLYIPIMLMIITVLSDSQVKTNSSVLIVALVIALALNALSVYRAHKNDFGLPFEQVLRSEDQEALKLSKSYISAGRKDVVYLESRDILYAQFPVIVTKQKLPHTLGVFP